MQPEVNELCLTPDPCLIQYPTLCFQASGMAKEQTWDPGGAPPLLADAGCRIRDCKPPLAMAAPGAFTQVSLLPQDSVPIVSGLLPPPTSTPIPLRRAQPHPIHPSLSAHHYPSPHPLHPHCSQATAPLVLTTNSLESSDLHPNFPQGHIPSDFLRRAANNYAWDLHTICIHF